MAYPGGKAGPGTYQRLIDRMPPHRVYIEPFPGAGAVLRHKRPAQENIGVELDAAAIAAHHADAPPNATVIHGDGLQYLREHRWQGDELVYCDPPYMPGSRTGGSLYACEMTEDGHRELLALLNLLRDDGIMVMISGYHSKLYARALRGWTLTAFGSMTRRGMALEHLWTSYPDPVELHDYRFLGDDYRERERIRKKVRRWTAKLGAMPKLERQALLAALMEADIRDEDVRAV